MISMCACHVLSAFPGENWLCGKPFFRGWRILKLSRVFICISSLTKSKSSVLLIPNSILSLGNLPASFWLQFSTPYRQILHVVFWGIPEQETIWLAKVVLIPKLFMQVCYKKPISNIAKLILYISGLPLGKQIWYKCSSEGNPHSLWLNSHIVAVLCFSNVLYIIQFFLSIAAVSYRMILKVSVGWAHRPCNSLRVLCVLSKLQNWLGAITVSL